MSNPAQAGIAAGRQDAARHDRIAAKFQGRGLTDAITYADAALALAVETRERLNQTIEAIESGDLLAAVGAFDGLPAQANELDVLLRLVRRQSIR